MTTTFRREFEAVFREVFGAAPGTKGLCLCGKVLAAGQRCATCDRAGCVLCKSGGCRFCGFSGVVR